MAQPQNRPQQHHIQYPLTPQQVENMEDMFTTLFKRLRDVTIFSTGGSGNTNHAQILTRVLFRS